MNKFIKKELDKCKVAKIPLISDDTIIIEIKRPNEDILSEDIAVNSCYVIELADYILKPPPGFTLASNWNRGINPTSKHLKCVMVQIMGKMIKIDGQGYDLQMMLHMGLWFPRAIKILQKLLNKISGGASK